MTSDCHTKHSVSVMFAPQLKWRKKTPTDLLFYNQLTSLRACSYQIDYVLVFSNSLHHFHLRDKICKFVICGVLWNKSNRLTLLIPSMKLKFSFTYWLRYTHHVCFTLETSVGRQLVSPQSVRPSVRPSVCPSVCPATSVHPSVRQLMEQSVSQSSVSHSQSRSSDSPVYSQRTPL